MRRCGEGKMVEEVKNCGSEVVNSSRMKGAELKEGIIWGFCDLERDMLCVNIR